jgi:glycosyltransferase involved in cell wall biosynthesis
MMSSQCADARLHSIAAPPATAADVDFLAMRPLRVLQVVLSLGPGGTERLVVDLSTRLDSAVTTAVCCLDEAGEWGQALAARGIPVTALHRKPGFHPALGLRVAAAIRAHAADVVHCHQYTPFVYGAIGAALRRCPIVFTEHGRLADAPPSPKRRRANAVLRHVPARVAAVSRDLRDHLVGEGFRREQVQVVYNGVVPGPAPSPAERAAVRRELGWSDEDFVAMSIGRLDPVKDFRTMIAAVQLASRDVPALRLAIVGDGPDRDSIEHAGRPLGNRLTLLGHRNDARRFLAGADLFLNSSIFEGVSLTILEAMAAGLPIVATAVGGTPEIVEDSYGRLVPPRSSETMADAIRGMAGDRPGCRAMGARARAAAEARFSLDAMLARYLEMYRSVA